ncbi:hypothetical protein H5410_036143 [Solanum commersonii]|uniref:Uncharacterized protein n=1 Tax=Solanum commersonii TaxID=4109 RepID=A0A9J5Y4T0_SOLCO|nr:hypothetical protein H5410_036143 [Solanum commersonii]
MRVFVSNGNDPDAVAKSMHKFVNYEKRKKVLAAEVLVTLLVKSVEKIWAKGLCASTYEASWLSKTRDSKVEDFTDRCQNVARVVGKAEKMEIQPLFLVEISRSRNIREDGNATTLLYRDINKPDQSKESQKEIHSAIPSEPITTKIKWSIEGWEGLTLVSCGQSKGKWSTEGWEDVHSARWGQPKENSGPSDSPWPKGKWSTKRWGKSSLANWGQSNGDNVPPNSIWTKRKRSDETWGETSTYQWLGKLDTKIWPKRKHNNKYAPKVKWSKMQT